MHKILTPIIKAVPTLIGLFKKRTPEKGRGIVKSGIASLTISGLLSTGRLSASSIDTTLLLILSILEIIGYLYGMVAISSGATQTYPVDELLKGKGDGLSDHQAKVLGQQWLKQMQKNQSHRIPGNSLFDDDYSDLKVKVEDISHYKSHKSKKKR
ncbi:hypothetical protein CK503_08550 [Aliifodinibius salipaludis]|jgi:hypothetical protein|uniref:Uncharacterized protein n=1 Tax=Fodinibius salipaludis TaxID=2032627 RepID=A0A2A2GBK1_9BACT|nr:hypothetical protein [Aliifodinibius salipaludis]PAU94253.1 hypothetical protein CK503_08550 [Aliifodinibius salipaludis]